MQSLPSHLLQHFYLNPLNFPQEKAEEHSRIAGCGGGSLQQGGSDEHPGQKAAVMMSETTTAATKRSGPLRGSAAPC